MMRIVSADWVFPAEGPPVNDGAVLLHENTVLEVGQRDMVKASVDAAEETRLKHTALLPGLINCHTHLELGVTERLPVRGGFTGWLRDLMKYKEGLSEEEIIEGAERAALVLYLMGTAYAADVASGPVPILGLLKTGLPATIFREFLGLGPDAKAVFEESIDLFDPQAEEGLSVLPSCHAPFSTSRELFEAVSQWSRLHGTPTKVHLAESRDEIDLLTKGQGGLKDFLEERGIATDRFPVPGKGPVAYLDELGFLNEHTIAVHLVQAEEKDLALLEERGVTPCLCPSSNLHLTGSLPPVEMMLRLGMKPCLGTDSPASGESLNLFREMEILLDAGVSAEDVFRMGTENGTAALRLPEDYGRLAPGGRTTLLALPCDTRKEKNPLVSAIRGGAKGWAKWVVSPRALGPVRVEHPGPAGGAA